MSREYDAYRLITGKKEERTSPAQGEGLEGKVTQITYAAPSDRSIFEIFKNYESALKKAGFDIIFQGKKGDMGGHWLNDFITATARPPKDTIGADVGARLGGSDFYYAAAKKERAEGDIYAAVCVALGWFQKFPLVQLDIIETKPMDMGMVTVDAEALEQGIKEKGSISVYGILFDTGKVDVKPESSAVLREIAAFLKKNPNMRLFIVGHTDNVGLLEFNLSLSQRRADAVVNILLSEYGVDNKRLHSAGIGPLSPVASNKTEAGRAKNRRVELVER